jgi:arsenate reductase
MTPKSYNVLFLCAGNSARSIMGEALLDAMGKGRFNANRTGSARIGREEPAVMKP